jgi:hypothetical protein
LRSFTLLINLPRSCVVYRIFRSGYRPNRKLGAGLLSRNPHVLKHLAFFNPNRLVRPVLQQTLGIGPEESASHPERRAVPIASRLRLRFRLDSDAIVHSSPQTLFTSKVTLSGLHADMPEQKLNLLKLSANGVAQACACAPKIMRG